MYGLIRFGTFDLKFDNQVDTIGSGPTPTVYQNLPEGGALDLFGDQQKHPGTVGRTLSRSLHLPTVDALNSLYLQLLGLRGKHDRLYRRTGSGDIHWMYARFVEVIAERSYEQTRFRLVQDVSLNFVCQEAFWRGNLGGQWYLDSGEYFEP